MDDPIEQLRRDPGLRTAGHRYEAALRAEAAEWERLAAKDLLRGRDLAAVAREACQRGDRVAAILTERTFTGRIVYVAGDLACVRTGAGDVDLNLRAPLTIGVLERSDGDGHGPGVGPPSFTARLFEHEAAGTRLSVGGRVPGGSAVGRIEAVALDHIVLVDDDEAAWYIAHTALDYVEARPPSPASGASRDASA